MNLSPDWIPVLKEAGFDAVHWSGVGEPRAPDAVIMEWARSHDCVVFTHDLDFGTLLANSHSAKPSVFQVRTQDVTPAALSAKVLATLRQHHSVLMEGAIVVLDEHRSRVRILPLN
jgi:predicted nuclease of predicted toxin-antitoxin system